MSKYILLSLCILLFSTQSRADFKPLTPRNRDAYRDNKRFELFGPKLFTRHYGQNKRYKSYFQFGGGRGWYYRQGNDNMLMFRFTIEW